MYIVGGQEPRRCPHHFRGPPTSSRYRAPMLSKLGIVTPVLTMLPRAHAAWEETAAFSDVVTIARAADTLGYPHLTCSEHVAVPTDVAAVRGARYFDPLATFGYLAAATARIK